MAQSTGQEMGQSNALGVSRGTESVAMFVRPISRMHDVTMTEDGGREFEIELRPRFCRNVAGQSGRLALSRTLKAAGTPGHKHSSP